MPIREFKCPLCSTITELFLPMSNTQKETFCKACDEAYAVLIPSSFGGYKMDSGPASVRPKDAGSFRKPPKGEQS